MKKLIILFYFLTLFTSSIYGQIDKNVQFPLVSDNDTVGYYLFFNQTVYDSKKQRYTKQPTIAGVFFIKVVTDSLAGRLNKNYKIVYGSPESFNSFVNDGNHNGNIVKDGNGNAMFPMINDTNPMTPEEMHKDSENLTTSSHLKRAGRLKNAAIVVSAITSAVSISQISAEKPIDSKVLASINVVGVLTSLVLNVIGNNELIEAGEAHRNLEKKTLQKTKEQAVTETPKQKKE